MILTETNNQIKIKVMNKNNPYIDINYVDRTQQVEDEFAPTVVDIQKDPEYYAELVTDLMYHWVYGTRETPLMFHAKQIMLIKHEELKDFVKNMHASNL